MNLPTQSPFPGCDPFLQGRWESYHVQYIVALGEQLRGRLPAGLRPRVESRVYLETTDTDGHSRQYTLKPDAFVVEFPKSYPAPSFTPTSWSPNHRDDEGTLVAEPIKFSGIPVELKERYIDIVDVNDGDRIVTSIEVLSPRNKSRGTGMDQFRQKQTLMREAGVSLVEIDLIRGGARAISVPHLFEDSAPNILFRIAVLEGWNFLDGKLYALTLQHRLPIISLPLRKTDAALGLDLQLAHDIAYDRGEFGTDIDYRQEPTPPLSKEDEGWADAMLRNKGLR